MRQLLNLEFLKVGIGGVQGNYKLIYFLCEKQNLEQLIRYSIGVPESPENQNEAFKFPNVSQELICSSAMLAQAVVEGGFEKMFERASSEEQNENPNADDEDDDDEDNEDDDEDEDGGSDQDDASDGADDPEDGTDAPDDKEREDEEREEEEREDDEDRQGEDL